MCLFYVCSLGCWNKICMYVFWLSLPRRVLSTSWCCPPRPCVAFLAFVHLPLFLALSLSPGNSLVSSWCDHSMLWRCLAVPCRRVSSFFLRVQLSQPYVATVHTSAFISRNFVEIGMLWLFHILCSDAPIACPLFNLVRNSVVHSPSSVIRDPKYGNVSSCMLQHMLSSNSKRLGNHLISPEEEQ